jgi:hypothetical protein
MLIGFIKHFVTYLDVPSDVGNDLMFLCFTRHLVTNLAGHRDSLNDLTFLP